MAISRRPPPPPLPPPTPRTPPATPVLRLPPLTLVLGGARSGKSAYAEALFDRQTAPVYIATGQAGDAEMAERIRRHQARRGGRWRTVEAPVDLAGALSAEADAGSAVLVDCLTLWLSNLLCAADRQPAGPSPEAEIDRLLEVLPAVRGAVVFVANEVGLGIVPDNALARRFRDLAGSLNQRLAAESQRVVLVAAGLPLLLKDLP